jgi:hypothetical protein
VFAVLRSGGVAVLEVECIYRGRKLVQLVLTPSFTERLGEEEVVEIVLNTKLGIGA